MLYNLGCVLSYETEDLTAALDVFEQFFERNNSTTVLRHMEADPDIDPMRQEPRFKTMLEAARERLGLPN